MSILIKGMEMPTSCYDCPLAMQDYTTLFGKKLSRTRNSYACVLTHKTITSTKRNRFCPLIPVPPHGRLIDADKLCELCGIMADKCDGIGESIWNQFKTTVEWCPTVIPVEGGESNEQISKRLLG